MFSSEKNSGRLSGRESERSGLTINLTVCGSPAPVYMQQAKPHVEQRRPKHGSKGQRGKEFHLPVNRIIYLAERLQLTSLTEKKVESVAAADVEARSLSEEVRRHGRDQRSKKQESQSREFSPSAFDFSLDLSSISNAGDVSDDLGLDFEEGTCSTPCNSKASETLQWVEEPCETSRMARISREGPSGGPHSAECQCATRGRRAEKCDLIHHYVNSVENQEELVKYFRPCGSCREACCVCSDVSFRSGVRRTEVSALDYACSPDKVNKGVETESSVTGLAWTGRRFRNSECCFSRVAETEAFPSVWNEGCSFKCRYGNGEVSNSASDDSFGSDRLPRIRASSLAEAAESARALARNLELILSSLDGER